MTLLIPLPDSVTRSLVDRVVDHDRPAAIWAEACRDANAILTTGFETLAEGAAVRRVRRRSAPARRS